MKKQLLIPIFIMGVLTNAQQKVNQEELTKIAIEEQAIYNDAKALERNNLSNFDMGEGVNFHGFYNGIPVYFASDSQSQINSMDVDYLQNNTIPGVAVTGEGMMVYIWDGGAVRTSHQEFTDRVTIVEAGSVSDHATGVAGVIISSGVNANAKGIAHGANLKSLNFTTGSTTAEMATQANLEENQSYMVSNHSYGSLTGWYQNPSGQWFWYGYPHLSETESALFGFYHPTDRVYDNIAYNSPQHSIFKSSGNNRNEGPNGAVSHSVLDETGQWVVVNDGTIRPKDCMENNGGYDCLSYAGSNAKNIILVGAVNPLGGNNRYEEPSDVIATWFSSYGPTDDGRIKPDVTAIGSNVLSPTSTNDTAYTSWSGTSFSSPAAAGVGVLLQQVAKEHSNGTAYLRSDMMKGLLTHTANESGTDLGPDYKFGWGLINALNAVETFLNVNQNSIVQNKVLSSGNTETITVTALGDEPLKVSITWLDPIGAPSAQVVLNDRTPKLVHDLDLRVSNGGETYFPWKLDPENPAAAATKGDNIVDNIEQVYIENPIAGQQYTITVSNKGNLLRDQNYAFIVTGADAKLATNEVDLNKSVSIYPNPVVDKLNLQISDKLTNATVRVFNPMGQVIYQNDYKSLTNIQNIDFKSIPSGIYMVYIKSDEGTITKKVIKK